jgi:DNA replication protein
MRGFAGFPEGKLKITPLPELFFSELLPIIDHLSELKVTLYCFWLLHQKRGQARYVAHSELRGDEVLMQGLSGVDALQEGLEHAVARGTLLEVSAAWPDRPNETLYFLNSEQGREAVARIERGEWEPQEGGEPARLQPRRPNIYILYEQNIGLIGPLLAEELKDAERTYPPEWIEDAFRIAVENNARSWAYVRTILQRWAREGRTGAGGEQDGRRHAQSKYADLIER